MNRLLLALAACASLTALTAPSARAQNASVVATCATGVTLQQGYLQAPLVQNTSGQLCVSSSGGGGGAVTTSPGVVVATDRGGTITTGGVAQNAMAANASRKQWCIQNSPNSVENLNVSAAGTASATAGVMLPPGAQACNQSGNIEQTAISVFAATTGTRWFGSEAQ